MYSEALGKPPSVKDSSNFTNCVGNHTFKNLLRCDLLSKLTTSWQLDRFLSGEGLLAIAITERYTQASPHISNRKCRVHTNKCNACRDLRVEAAEPEESKLTSSVGHFL